MSAWGHAFFLAIQALRASPWQSVLLILGVAGALFLPAFTWDASDALEARLVRRAQETPLILGARGSAFDLTFAALAFRGVPPETLPFDVLQGLQDGALGAVVPLHLGHRASGAPVVGTELDYLAHRGLRVAQGRTFALLGEVLVGAELAAESGLRLGDRLLSAQANLYNLAGAFPMALEVVGILAPSTSPDDGVFFVDLKTAWAMDGHLHGHQGVAGALTNAEAGALYLYGDFSEEGVEDFHLHGDVGALPISAALIFPFDRAKHDILLGRFQDDTLRQLIRPEEVVDRVLSWLLHLRRGLMAYFSVVGMLTGLFILLVGALALRLRAEELRLMVLLGATRGRVAAMVGAEWGLLFGVGALLAGGGLWLSRRILLMFLI